MFMFSCLHRNCFSLCNEFYNDLIKVEIGYFYAIYKTMYFISIFGNFSFIFTVIVLIL